jgi:hypothetical protein
MKVSLFIAADLWMVFAGLRYGWKFIGQYGNFLLGLEWLIVGTSGVNYLIWALLGASEANPQSAGVHFLDSFSRAVGITLILVLGLMAATHRYKPPVAVDVAVFGLGIAAGAYLMRFGAGHDLHTGPAAAYVVANALTTAFLAYLVHRLWSIGAKALAAWSGLATAAGLFVALTYDFFPLPFDDADRTIFAICALTTWGTQLFVYFFAYRALHDHNVGCGSAS